MSTTWRVGGVCKTVSGLGVWANEAASAIVLCVFVCTFLGEAWLLGFMTSWLGSQQEQGTLILDFFVLLTVRYRPSPFIDFTIRKFTYAEGSAPTIALRMTQK